MAGRRSDPNKRSQILRAATDVFSAREFHTVPVEDVATAAGVGKGTLYLYFPTKEQLFYATILEALDVLLVEVGAAVRGRTGEDALRRVHLDLLFQQQFGDQPGPYERLLADALAGNQQRFSREDMVIDQVDELPRELPKIYRRIVPS